MTPEDIARLQSYMLTDGARWVAIATRRIETAWSLATTARQLGWSCCISQYDCDCCYAVIIDRHSKVN